MSSAFEDLANGNFQNGLLKLSQCTQWQDELNTLDGPFYIGFPGKKGWGEGLLIASLLKRHAAATHNKIEGVAHKSVCSILEGDGSFLLKQISEDQDFRS